MADSHDVVNNKSAHRFELEIEGELAVLDYEERDKVIDLTHTNVPTALEGHGVGSALVQAALAYVKQSGKRLIATCPFVQSYIKRHPDWASLTN